VIRTEAQVAAETVAMLFHRGVLPMRPKVVAEAAAAARVPLSTLRQAWDRIERGYLPDPPTPGVAVPADKVVVHLDAPERVQPAATPTPVPAPAPAAADAGQKLYRPVTTWVDDTIAGLRCTGTCGKKLRAREQIVVAGPRFGHAACLDLATPEPQAPSPKGARAKPARSRQNRPAAKAPAVTAERLAS
jgi:hypothetical protein